MVILRESITWLWASVEEGVPFLPMTLLGTHDLCFVKLKSSHYGCMLSSASPFFKVMKVTDNGGDYSPNFYVLPMLVHFPANESG